MNDAQRPGGVGSAMHHTGSAYVRPTSWADAEVRLHKEVRDLGDNGALDEGTDDAFDSLIDSWHRREREALGREHAQRVLEVEVEQARSRVAQESARACSAADAGARAGGHGQQVGAPGPITVDEPADVGGDAPARRQQLKRTWAAARHAAALQVHDEIVTRPRGGDGRNGSFDTPYPGVPWQNAIEDALLCIAALGDAAVFYSTLAGAMPDAPEQIVWVAVASLTAAAVGLMHLLGRALPQPGARGATSWSWVVALLLPWLAIGVLTCLVRVQNGGAASTSSFHGGSPQVSWSLASPTVDVSLLFFALFLGSGAMAAWIGNRQSDPILTALKAARRELRRSRWAVARAHPVWLPRLVRAVPDLLRWRSARRLAQRVAELDARRAELDARRGQLDANLDSDLRDCDVRCNELKQLVRLEMARFLGQPAATNLMTRTDEQLHRPNSASGVRRAA